jgi:hypothetical protein
MNSPMAGHPRDLQPQECIPAFLDFPEIVALSGISRRKVWHSATDIAYADKTTNPRLDAEGSRSSDEVDCYSNSR